MEDMSNNWNNEADGITRIERYRVWTRCFQSSASPQLATEVPARDAFRKPNALPKTSAYRSVVALPVPVLLNFANP